MTETETKSAKHPRSIYDLEGEFIRLLEMAHQGFDPETGEYLNEDEIDRAFAELEGDLDDKIAGCGFVIMRLKKEAAMVDEEAKRLRDKKARMDKGRERLEERVRDLMILVADPGAGKSVKKPWISVTIAKPSKNKVQLLNAKLIPSEFMTVPQAPDPKPIMAEIKKALKAKIEVPGAELVQGRRTLTIT